MLFHVLGPNATKKRRKSSLPKNTTKCPDCSNSYSKSNLGIVDRCNNHATTVFQEPYNAYHWLLTIPVQLLFCKPIVSKVDYGF